MISKLTREQQKAVEELHVRIKNYLPASLSGDDLVLYKFLKARDFDVGKAEKMLRKHIHWRKVYQVDTFLEDFKPKEFYIKIVNPTLLGLDKAGNMVQYLPMGALDTKDILRCSTMNAYVRHFIWNFETERVRQKEENEKKGRLHQTILIFDLDKLTISNATSKVSVEQLMKLLNVSQDNYPEALKTIYMINCPSYYAFVFSILKPIMSKAFSNKFKVFGRSGWKEKLVEETGEDILPAFLGGKRTDPDGNPMCNTFVRHAGMMPEIYYLSKEERYFEDATQVKKAIIAANKRKEIQVQVTENGSRIEWVYLVKSNDIGFGLDFCVSEGQVECILPVEKFSTPDGTEKGFYRCKKQGRYVIIFDNSHSWMTSKEVDYVVKITNP